MQAGNEWSNILPQLDKSHMAGRRKSDEMRRQTAGAPETGQSFSAVAARFTITKGEIGRLVAKYRRIGNLKVLP